MGTLSVRELKQGFVHLFYPALCEGCRRQLVAGETALCIICAAELPETGYHLLPGNDTELRFAGRIPFVQATSYAWFTTEGLLQHLLHGLKYRGRKAVGTYLGSRFGQSLSACGWGRGIDVIVPVPLHPAREAQRGYNQSMLIAAAMGRELGIGVAGALLARSRITESQTNKTRTERAENMAGAFFAPSPHELQGRHVLIVDDVLTTGATIEACALALMAVADVKISIATIGIAVS